VWEQEGGTGTPPAAWVRNDGVVRFNRAKFKMPDLSDLHPQQYGPVRQPPKVQQPLMYEDLVRPPAGGVKPPPGRAVLPEYVGRPALFGPDSKIAHSINDRSEASALYRRFHDAQQQISQTMHEDATLVAWNQWGGEGTPPAAWVRTDGVVHFNLAKIDLPEAVADWYAQGIAQGTAIAPGSEAPK
jgi:hypothetical protein